MLALFMLFLLFVQTFKLLLLTFSPFTKKETKKEVGHTHQNPRPMKIRLPVDPTKENMVTKVFVKQGFIAGGLANQLVKQIKSMYPDI